MGVRWRKNTHKMGSVQIHAKIPNIAYLVYLYTFCSKYGFIWLVSLKPEIPSRDDAGHRMGCEADNEVCEIDVLQVGKAC